MELSNQKKLANHIFRLLKVSEVVIPIGRTNKGNLGLKFSQNSDDFEIMLDAVPLSVKDMLVDDNNIEVKKMIEKYWFEEKEGLSLDKMKSVYNSLPDSAFIENAKVPEVIATSMATDDKLHDELSTPKRRGRPAGSKNISKKEIAIAKEKLATIGDNGRGINN